ncbi:MAG: hypothetical protein J6573_07530 [Lactobacillus sp.]|nr:hypothetical protein [Lactobacillus sp.]
MVEEVIGHDDNHFVPGAPNHGITQPNDPNSQQAQNPVIPPLSYPDRPRDPNDPYDYITTDVPNEQPIIIYLNHAQAGYLPHASTIDENEHLVPQNVYNRRTRERVFPIAFIRQGEAGGVRFRFRVLSYQGKVDLSDFYMIRFQGHDYQNHFISSDVGFDTTQMSLGEFTWEPEEAIGLTSGKYVSAQIVLEKQDRTQRSISLDFDLHIIPNDVAFPRPMAFYVSEYQRALFHIKEMQDLADRHIGYTIDFFDNVVTDALLAAEKKVLQAIADDNKKLDDALATYKKKIDDSLNDFDKRLDADTTKLGSLETGLQKLQQKELSFESTLNSKLADLQEQLKQKDLVTRSDMAQMFQDEVNAGHIDINDQIDSAEAQAILDSWYNDDNATIEPAKTITITDVSDKSAKVVGM